MEKEKRRTQTDIIVKVLRFFSLAVIVIELISVFLLVVPAFLSYRSYVIISDSMKPTLKVNDLVYIEPAEPTSL